ncbi:hypothetical protein EUX98_g4129 [Antrodiella citrinella]|uniref:EamA domain-containing protein n=1 Tax=Antrodiella citrinella TaxID=2447956 RepID=A0A4S4MUT4_9APHY|nr:hypothetical protein EUX98_g4129 [Antrodiella citrinella]
MSEPSHHSPRGKSPLRIPSLQKNKDYVVGVCLLLVVVFLWTSSNFVTQGLFDDGFEKPFLITYLCTSSFTLYLIPYVVRKAYRRWMTGNAGLPPREGYQALGTEPAVSEILTPLSPPTIRDPSQKAADEGLPPLTVEETARLAAWFCILWFIANWSLTASLDYTSVASATILSSMSGFFTLAIGRVFRVETLTIVKIAAVVTSFGGITLVSLSDSSSQQDQPASLVSRAPLVHTLTKSLDVKHVTGDSLALLSALFYALYVILLKVRIRSESRIDMQLFFGFVGLFSVLFTWPVGVVLHLTGLEPFELPSKTSSIIGVLVSMAITLSSDFIYVLAMLKTTPLVVTIGLSLTMPLAVLGDFILKKPTTGQVILGAAIVLLSFVAVGLEDSKNQEEEDVISGRRLDEEGDATVRLSEDVQLDSREDVS